MKRFDLSEASFAGIWRRLRLGGSARPLHMALRAAWREPQRHYHNTAHLRDCLGLLQRWQASARDPDQVALALWFHDAVYQPQANDNEARSAAWAAQALQSAGAGESIVARIGGLIMATAHGSKAACSVDDPDRDLLLDIDLAILGATLPDYQRYRWQIRREYAWVPPTEYRRGRARVLQQFLDLPQIYRAAQARALEAEARRNLREELAVLTGSALV